MYKKMNVTIIFSPLLIFKNINRGVFKPIMARGKRSSKTIGGLLHSSIRQLDLQPLEHNRPSVSVGRFECFLPGCSSSLGTKDAFKKTPAGKLTDPEISADLLYKAGFAACAVVRIIPAGYLNTDSPLPEISDMDP